MFTIKKGDITQSPNTADIIIGMNRTLSEVTGIGLPFVTKYPSLKHPIEPGSVISCPYKFGRYLHMIICHEIGENGWVDAEKYIRYGMDHLWYTERDRTYSAVQIGSGRIGKRDGANESAIMAAMANSLLTFDLYVYEKPGEEEAATNVVAMPPLRAHRIWYPRYGEQRIAA